MNPATPSPAKTGRPCEVCKHPHRDSIERDISVGGARLTIARKYGLTRSSIGTHSERCIPTLCAEARAAAAKRGAKTAITVEKMSLAIIAEAKLYLEACKTANDLRSRGTAIGRLIQAAELRAKLTGELRATLADVGADDAAAAAASLKQKLDALLPRDGGVQQGGGDGGNGAS